MKHVYRLLATTALALAVGFSLTVTPLLAQDSASLIKYRQRIMRSLSGHSAALGEIAKSNLPYQSHVAVHARGLAALAELLPQVFPTGTEKGKTDALPAVWDKPDEFKKAAEEMGAAAAKLASMGGSGDVKAQIKALGKTCGGCHKKFRQPKEKRFKRK